jgi:predicted ribosome quality control (RQC) complex YloA/Tae2 family protein
MVFDGFFIFHLIKELNQELEKARLEKIYQNDETSFVFAFYAKGSRKYVSLNLSPHRFGIHITEYKQHGALTSQFLVTMKKHLEGAILESITQYETDRVMILNFTSYDFIDGPVSKKLVFEAMGRHSNLLMIKDEVIVDTYKKMFFDEGRQLLPQAKFEFFPSDKKSFESLDYDDAESPKDLVDQYLGVSPFLAKYLFETKADIRLIKVKPTRNLKTRKDYVFDIFKETDEKVYFETISEMMDHEKEEKRDRFLSHRLFIDKQIAKYDKRLAQQEMSLDEAKEKLENKNFGDQIYQSGHPLDEKRSSIDIGDLHIVLDPTKTLNENAQTYYKAYAKAKRSLNHIVKQMEQTKEMIDLFHEFKTYLDFANHDNIKDLETELIEYGYKGSKTKKVNKKQEKKPNIIKLVEGDVTYYIGKNSLQNEYVTHTLGKKDDYWFHVKDAPGAHVVVTTNELDEHILRKSAMLAAFFSGMRQSSSIPVDYTLIKNIKKIPGVPGYRVTYRNHQTIYIDIDEEKIDHYLKNV